MIRNIFIFATGLLLVCSNCLAVSMIGTVPCDKWTKDHQKNNWAKVANSAWLVGYMAGITQVTGKNFLAGIDLDFFMKEMNDYCQHHPEKNVVDGVWQTTDTGK